MGWGAGGAYMLWRRRKKEEKVKWECVEVNHDKNVGGTIEEWEKNGWDLYSYTAAGYGTAINHYLLFTRSELKTT